MSDLPQHPQGSPLGGGGCPLGFGSAVGSGGNSRSESPINSVLGFETHETDFIEGKTKKPVPHYSSYLAIEQLMKLQDGPAASKPEGKGLMHREELTFIIVHQVFELWFKLVIADLGFARDELRTCGKGESESDLHHQLTTCLQYLRRTEAIFGHAVGAFGIMETMHPADFIEFRDFLIPASGFQSSSFRALEILLGVPSHTRLQVNGATVFSFLTPEEQKGLKEHAEKGDSINECLEALLTRIHVPEEFEKTYLECAEKQLRMQQFDIARAKPGDERAEELVRRGVESMKVLLSEPAAHVDDLFVKDEGAFRQAILAALFVISYRHSPRYSLLADVFDNLLACEEGMLLWRSRHLHMAERMIGRRKGTGGSFGVGYLDGTRGYRIFNVLWLVRKLFIRSSLLPDVSTFGTLPLFKL